MEDGDGEDRVLEMEAPFVRGLVRGVKDAGRRRVQPGPRLGEFGNELTLVVGELTERESRAENGSDCR